MCIYIAHCHKVSNTLGTLVPAEKPSFQTLSEGLIVLLCTEVVWQGVSDHGAVHRMLVGQQWTSDVVAPPSIEYQLIGGDALQCRSKDRYGSHFTAVRLCDPCKPCVIHDSFTYRLQVSWYLYNLLQLHQPSRALRSSTQQLLQVPYMSTDFGRCTFSYSSPATWNSILTAIKNCSSLYSFKRHLKSHLTAQLINN